MFGNLWKWAGKIRTSERTIGIAHWEIREALHNLLDDGRTWLQYESYPVDEIAVRFHHRLVAIHCFVNGNGRHARLVTELLLETLGHEPFTWEGDEIVLSGAVRQRYVQALKSADAGDYAPLLEFARG